MILVTGASGFLGRHVVRRFLGAGEAVRCVCRPGSPGADWLKLQPVEVVYAHLHEPESMACAFRDVRYVVHLAAPIREVRNAVIEQFHHQTTACVVAAARAAGVDRLLMVSPIGSSASAGLPFLRSRGLAEERVRASGLPHVILQSSVMFGVADRLIGGIMRLVCRTGLLVIPGTGKTMLQPIWVGDVVSCLLRALRDDAVRDQTIPIGGPQHLSYEEIADQVGTMLNVPRSKIHLSQRFVSVAGRVLEGLGRNPFLAHRHLEMLEVGTITALDSVKRAFGFQPMPLVEGIAYALAPTGDPGRQWLIFGAERGSGTRTRYRV
jgi:NADH dehydrogenase